MNELSDLFMDMRQNKAWYLTETSGTDFGQGKARYRAGESGANFEDKMAEKLGQAGYEGIDGGNFQGGATGNLFKLVKHAVLEKSNGGKIANNTEFNRHFIPQPFSTQNYPDFLVFSGKWIFGVETKFSTKKQNKPVWNSGLPRPNGIYIFGSMERKDLTFFLGGDVLSAADARKLHDFFGDIRQYQTRFNEGEMTGQEYGFAAYIRKAFDQKREFNENATLNFFDNPKREKLEDAVIAYLREGGINP